MLLCVRVYTELMGRHPKAVRKRLQQLRAENEGDTAAAAEDEEETAMPPEETFKDAHGEVSI